MSFADRRNVLLRLEAQLQEQQSGLPHGMMPTNADVTTWNPPGSYPKAEHIQGWIMRPRSCP